MSLIFMDGMYYPTNDLPYKYSGEFDCSISSESRRVGPGSIYMPGVDATGYTIQYNPPTAITNCIVGLAYRIGGRYGGSATILKFGSSNISVTETINDELTLYTPNGSDTTAIGAFNRHTWFYLELKYVQSSTVASVTLKINGVDVAGVTNKNLDTDTSSIRFSNSYTDTPYYFQDFYVLDDSGTTNNDFLGDVKVDCIRPNSPGTYADFTPSTGSNWENVDESDSDGDTTYNEAGVVNYKDTYSLSDISLTGQEIFGIQQQSIMRKTDASSRACKQLIKSGTTEDLGNERSLNDSYTGYQRILEEDPDTLTQW